MNYDGNTLKVIRQKKNIQLKEIAQLTHITFSYLKSIEDENYAQLPPEVYFVGYLKHYSVFLKIDPEKVIEDYLVKYRAWKGSAPVLH